MTPTNEMFELSLGYDMGVGGDGGAGGGGGIDYGYNGYNEMGFGCGGVGDLGLEMGYVMPSQELGLDAMWNNVVVGRQAQQA